MASLKELKIQQAKRKYETAKAKGDRAGMVRAHSEADMARGQYTKTVNVNGQYQQQTIGNMGQEAASGGLLAATRKLNQSANTGTVATIKPSMVRNAPAPTRITPEQQEKNTQTLLGEMAKSKIARTIPGVVAGSPILAGGLVPHNYDSRVQAVLDKNATRGKMFSNPHAVAQGLQAPKSVDVKINDAQIGEILGNFISVPGEGAIGTMAAKGLGRFIKNKGKAAVPEVIQKTVQHTGTYQKIFTPTTKDAAMQDIAQQIANMPNPRYAPGLVSKGLEKKLNDLGSQMDQINKMTDVEWFDYAKKNGLGSYSGRTHGGLPVRNVQSKLQPETVVRSPQVTPEPRKGNLGVVASQKRAAAENVALNRASDDAVITTTPGKQGADNVGRQSTDNVPPINRSGVKPGYEVRGFSENIATDANMDEKIRQMYAEDPDIYEIAKNKDTLKRATDEFTASGTRDSYDNVMKAIASNTLKPEHVPLARMIANDLIKSGDPQGARNILSEISAKLTESGQFSQAANILRNSDPMAVLQFIQKTIDKTNTGLKKRFKNFEGLKLTDEEIQKLGNIDMGDTDAISQAVEEIGTRLAKEVPSGWFDKFDELRRIAMLGNFKTQGRNVAGNLPLMLERKLSNKTSALLQMKLSKENRTQALFTTKESRNIAKQLYANDKDWLLDSNKWDTNEFRKILNSERRVFSQSVLGRIAQAKNAGEKVQSVADLMGLEGIRKLVYGALQLGDSPFLKSAYVDRMASYISAQGYKSIEDVPQKAIDTAREEALKATFRDANSAAQFINNIKRQGGLKVSL